MFNTWKELILKDSSANRLNENANKIVDMMKVDRGRSVNSILGTLSSNKELVLIG